MGSRTENLEEGRKTMGKLKMSIDQLKEILNCHPSRFSKAKEQEFPNPLHFQLTLKSSLTGLS